MQTKERISAVQAPGTAAVPVSTTTPADFRRRGPLRMRPGVEPVVTPRVSVPRQIGHFIRHYFEMCIPMCVGFALGDLAYFWAAGLLGYSEPFRELPELSLLVVTFTMTAPMTAWMLFRGMPRRAIAEMSAAMPVLAIVLLAFAWLSVLRKGDLALLEHGLMMPVMLVPMFLRLDLYTAGHTRHRGGGR